MKKKYNTAHAVLLVLMLSAGLYGGDIELVEVDKVNLDKLNILKPTHLKVNQGNIYIYDEANAVFFVLDKEFMVKNTFCKKGEGPAECRGVAYFGFHNNRVWVYDGFGKMAWYNLDGTFTGESRKNTKLAAEQAIIGYIDPGKYFSIENQVDEKYNKVKCLYFISGSNKIKLTESWEKGGFVLEMSKRSQVLFAMGKKWSYIVPSDGAYHVKRFDNDKMTFSGSIEKKEYKNIPLTECDLADMKEKLVRIKREYPYLMEFDIKLPTVKPAINEITVDEKDRLYLVTNTSKDRTYSVEVFDETLECKTQFDIPASKLFSLTENLLFLISLNESTESYWLYRYRLNI